MIQNDNQRSTAAHTNLPVLRSSDAFLFCCAKESQKHTPPQKKHNSDDQKFGVT
jgi:hypothetical protein